MKERELTHKEVKGKVEKFLGKCKAVFMATNGSHGHPNVRAMVPLRVDGTDTLWFITDLDSSKIIELVKDDKAVIYAYEPRTMVECRLWGTIAILEDGSSIRQLWHDALRKYFDGPEDPRIRVLRFDVSNGVYCGKDHEAIEFRS